MLRFWGNLHQNRWGTPHRRRLTRVAILPLPISLQFLLPIRLHRRIRMRRGTTDWINRPIDIFLRALVKKHQEHVLAKFHVKMCNFLARVVTTMGATNSKCNFGENPEWKPRAIQRLKPCMEIQGKHPRQKSKVEIQSENPEWKSRVKIQGGNLGWKSWVKIQSENPEWKSWVKNLGENPGWKSRVKIQSENPGWKSKVSRVKILIL